MPEVNETPVEAPVEPVIEENAPAAVEAVEGAEAVAEVEAAIEDGASEAEVKELIKKVSYKVNGKESEYEIDVNNEDKLRELIQKGMAGQQAMQSAREKEKADVEMMDFWKKNPEKFLSDSGVDPLEFAEMMIQNQIQQMQKTPQEIKQEEMENELNDLRAKIKLEEDAKTNRELEVGRAQAEKDVRGEIEAALDATNILPKNAYVTQRVAEVWHSALAEGRDISAEDVIPSVKKELMGNTQELLNSVPEEFLEEWFGKKLMEKMRTTRLAKMPENTTSIKPTGIIKETIKEKKKINLEDWLKGNSSL